VGWAVRAGVRSGFHDGRDRTTVPIPMSTELLERVRAIARLGALLGDAVSAEHLGVRACRLGRELFGVDAVALFLDPEAPRPVAVEGFTLLPPDNLLSGLQPEDLDRLRAWASGAGFQRTELAPVFLDHHLAGLYALFSVAPGPVLTDPDLAILGDIVGAALMHVRATCELKTAYERRDRDQDQTVRKERMGALGSMALGIAHDVNNVLNGILAQVGVLQGLAAGNRDLLDTVERLRKTALEGAATVEKVQEFTRQRRDQDEFVGITFAEIVEAAGTAARNRAGDGLTVNVATSGSVTRVLGNADELGEAIGTLVDNAIEAMPAGGTLGLTLSDDTDALLLVVSDTGRGMSKDVRRRAFDPFFTTKGSRRKGLGLSLAYGVVRRHGGRIDLESTPGEGTRVKVRLPIHTPVTSVAAAPAAEPAARPARSGPLRVLLVEDDPDNREAMTSLLELSGYEVTAAETGSDGVRAFGDAPFDLVLTDLGLPDMNGWQVAGSIKSAAPQIPVALITGWGFNLAPEEIRRRGVDLLVKKPIDPRRFLTAIESLL
jgi:signal transduction histidine kinase